MDDAGGSVAAWEAVKLVKTLGLTPRRTVRVVLWTNEENGGRGGTAYRDAHKNELPKHFAAIESDNGIFAPTGFRLQGTADGARRAALIAELTKLARRSHHCTWRRRSRCGIASQGRCSGVCT